MYPTKPPLSLLLLVTMLACLVLRSSWVRAEDQDRLRVGVQPDGRIVVPTNQILKPAGRQVTFPGRPVDLAFVDQQTLVIKNHKGLLFLDVGTGEVKQTLDSKVGFSVVGLLTQGDRVYVTDAQNHVRLAQRQGTGRYQWGEAIEMTRPKVGGAAHPAGLAYLGPDRLLVTSTRGNSVQVINTATGKVEQVVQVGVAPYTVVCAGPRRCYVSNWGGDLPGAGDPQALSSDTPVRVDPRTSVADHGTVSVLDLADGAWRQRKTIAVGRHPSGLLLSPQGRFLYVANANSDTVSAIDTSRDEVVETISCRPEARLPFGSGCNALALSPDAATLFVANGTNNCVAVVRLGRQASEAGTRHSVRQEMSTLAGLIPTGWYPGALQQSADGAKLFVANVKGHGSLSGARPGEKGRNSHDYLGSVSLIDVPGDEQLRKYTEVVHANNRLAYSLAGLEQPRPDVQPMPLPQRHGESSLLQHVIYVIKENRTYDQVFGDVKEGNGDPRLTIFGEEVTPNHHALTRQFTLFDNFYCSGVLSADGHSWVNEAYVTDYLEKSFGGFTRSYPYEGSDPLAFANTGFLWDNALHFRKTFRNFGEFVKTTHTPKGVTWADVYADYRNETRKVKIAIKPNLKSLEPYSHPGYPGFPLTTPDVYRAQLFLEEFQNWERRGEMPNLVYLFLPCDHTSGTKPGWPTPAAMVADNDLALGRIVEAVSKSKFWPRTCIFVVEDDPQNGFDHVDGHRTVALVISPYTKRKFVDSTCYNQTGMVKSIELILGLPPMTQLDLSATPMSHCFTDQPDLTPYTVVPNKVPLDQMNKPLGQLRGRELYWAKKSMELDFDKEDEADEDTLNRILWHAVRGWDTAYPTDTVDEESLPGVKR
jgi:YVTN family beta-propeller protein